MFPLTQMAKSLIRAGSLTLIDADGRRTEIVGASPGPRVTVRFADRALPYQLMANPNLVVGEAYMDGRLTFEDGSTVRDGLMLFAANRSTISSYPLQRLIRASRRALKRFQQANPIGKARKNVAHHYDIGNDFYRLFLDAGMLYSCAYFVDDSDDLERAQENKLHLIAAKLDPKPGQKILDIGSGWGGLALYLAAVADVDVTGVTLSAEQHALSNERARKAGLADRVRFELRDYREVEGKFDRIVSVGMFEHVGVPHYGEYFGKVGRLLTDDGIMLLHSIGHMKPPGTSSAWITKYIFPGGYAPALSETFAAVEKAGLWVTDVEILRLHYARTLREWERRFQANRARMAAMYDERFCRMWEFYLVSSEMMFSSGPQQVFQMQITRKVDGAPIVRDYMVERQRELRALWEERRDRIPPV